eukprot:694270_1
MRNLTIFLLLLIAHASASNTGHNSNQPDDRHSVYQRYADQYIPEGVPHDITALISKFVGQNDKIPLCGICNLFATINTSTMNPTMNPYKCLGDDHIQVHRKCLHDLILRTSKANLDINSLRCPKCYAGLRHGYGTTTHYNGKAEFEGTWENGERKLGTSFRPNGEMVYSGPWKNGVWHTQGEEKGKRYKSPNKLWFIGEFKDGVRCGEGKRYYLNGSVLNFVGNYKDDKKDGYGTEYSLTTAGRFVGPKRVIIYEGSYKNG